MRDMDIAAAAHVVVTSGSHAETTWVVRLGDGRLACPTTGAVDGPVTVRVEGSSPAEGVADVVRSGRTFDEAHGRLRLKYGVRWRLDQARRRLVRRTPRDPVLLVRLDGTGDARLT